MGLWAWNVSWGRCAAAGGFHPGGFEKSGGSCPNCIDVSCAMSTRLDLHSQACDVFSRNILLGAD